MRVCYTFDAYDNGALTLCDPSSFNSFTHSTNPSSSISFKDFNKFIYCPLTAAALSETAIYGYIHFTQTIPPDSSLCKLRRFNI